MANGDQAVESGWMADVQRALAIVLVGTFALTLLLLTVRIIIWGDPPTMVDLLKTLISALINVVMLVLGYFYGSSKAKEQSDTSQQKIVEKLTSTAPPGPTGPVAPLPGPSTAPWWGKLTDAEKNAITAEGVNDPRVAAFITASTTGAATPDDLAYLVTKGLLTQDRATAIAQS